jgi:hypothetical protein
VRGSDIAAFLRANVEPLVRSSGLVQYRASAFLRGGWYLPCVVFEGKGGAWEYARAASPARSRGRLADYLDAFGVWAWGPPSSRIGSHLIRRIERCPFAWPLRLLEQIHGETVMSVTAFVVRMKDGRKFCYAVASMGEPFYDLPKGYANHDIAQVYSGMVYTEAHGIEDYRISIHRRSAHYYEEKKYFYCCIPELDP